MTSLDHVRLLKPADYEDLARFFQANSGPEVVERFHPFPLNNVTAAKLCTHSGLDRYYICSRGEARVIGFLMLRGWDEGFQTPSLGILIDGKHRGTGIGRQLMEFAINECTRLECPAIRLSVYSDNLPAVTLYQSLGFATQETRPSGSAKERKSLVMLRALNSKEKKS